MKVVAGLLKCVVPPVSQTDFCGGDTAERLLEGVDGDARMQSGGILLGLLHIHTASRRGGGRGGRGGSDSIDNGFVEFHIAPNVEAPLQLSCTVVAGGEARVPALENIRIGNTAVRLALAEDARG